MKLLLGLVKFLMTIALMFVNKVFWLPVTVQAMFSFAKEKTGFKEAFKNAKVPNDKLIITDDHDSSLTHFFFVFPTIMIIMVATNNDKHRDSLLLPFLASPKLRLAALYSVAYYGRHA